MLSRLRKMYDALKPKSEYQQMMDYLGQATDRYHLEFLMKQWDERSHRKNWM